MTSMCNYQLFPKDRTKCHKCFGESCVNLLESDQPSACIKNLDDQCYVIVQSNNKPL